MSQPIAVEIDHLFFAYERQQVLEDVSLRIGRGEFVGLVGPNGSGKSTLLRLILGLQAPQSGRISLFGQDLDRFQEWRRVGYVPQKASSLVSSFPATVGEVVQTGRMTRGRIFRHTTGEDRRLVRQALKLVNLESLEHHSISQLSGGQQQRAFIARALASDPELLILDEPTEGVDARTQEQFYALLRRLWQDMGLTIILVSHDIGVVTSQVSSLVCINRRVFCHGSPESFRLKDLSDFYGYPVAAVAHHH